MAEFLANLGREHIKQLKPLQTKIIESVKINRETLGILPTGYGKSIAYQLLPYVLSGTVLVFSPLTAIQEQQLQQLGTSDLKTCILNTKGRVITGIDLDEEILDLHVDDSSNSDIMAADLIFLHPEALFSTVEGNQLLESDRSKVKAVVVDECHKVEDWGKSFRKSFQNIRNIGAFFPGIPKLGLSATITVEEEKSVISSLGMMQPKVIRESPDRPNIYLDKIVKDSGNLEVLQIYEAIFKPLCDELKLKGSSFPLTLLFMPQGYLGYPASYCRFIFDNPKPENSLYATVCSGMEADTKDPIFRDLCSEEPKKRLIFCTPVLSMGFDAPKIERVIHARPPRNISDYLQQIGRAGRAGQQSEAILYYCKKDISNNLKDIKDDIISYCNEKGCLRTNILKHFGYDNKFNSCLHLCCNFCRSSCTCIECELCRIET